jgi:hypothetical protein
MLARAGEVCSKVGANATPTGVSFDVMHVKERHAAEGVFEGARSTGCDLIIKSSSFKARYPCISAVEAAALLEA